MSAVLALENRNDANGGADQRLAVEFDEIAGAHGQQLLHRGVGTCQLGHQGHLGGLDLALEHLDPAAVHFDGVALCRGIQHITDGLQRCIGHADVDGARDVADLQLKGRGHDDFAGRGDVGELRLHLRTLVAQLQRIDAVPGLLVFLADHVDQAVDHALLGVREVTSFDTRLQPARAAVQRIDDTEHQRGVADHQAAAAQRTDGDDVEVGGHHQLAQEGAVALHRHRAHGHFGAAADEVEQADAEVAGKALVDDFHRRHAPAHDALLAGDVVLAGGGPPRPGAIW